MRRIRQGPRAAALLPAFAFTLTTGILLSVTDVGNSFVVVLPDVRLTRTAERRTCAVLRSSVGGSGMGPSSPGDNGGRSSEWDEFLNPQGEESEHLFRAREFMSENSLPISHGVDGDVEREPFAKESNEKSSAIVGPNDFIVGGLSKDTLARNPYMRVVSQLSPSDLISKFTATAHPRVQNAVRNTILGLIGGLPKMAFETTTITTGQKLASLMFQLQMTGYMFKVRCLAFTMHDLATIVNPV